MTHKQNYLYNLLDDRQWSLPGDDTFLAGTHTRYRMLFHWRNTQAPRMMDNYPRKCTARPWDQTPCILQSTCRKHWCTGQDLLTNDTHNNSKCKILAKSNVSFLFYLSIHLFIYLFIYLFINSISYFYICLLIANCFCNFCRSISKVLTHRYLLGSSNRVRET